MGTQISMKASICDGDFPMRFVERSISRRKRKGDVARRGGTTINTINRLRQISHENLKLGKTTGGEIIYYIFFEVTVNSIVRLCAYDFA